MDTGGLDEEDAVVVGAKRSFLTVGWKIGEKERTEVGHRYHKHWSR
jgi:hypothetical protein